MLYALEALFALSPIYIWRFSFGGGSINALEILVVAFWIIFAAWLVCTNRVHDFAAHTKNLPRFFIFSAALFFVAALISTAISPDQHRAIGQLIALFIEPLGTYFAASYILRDPESKKRFINFVLALVEVIALYAILQYFTHIGLPQQWWGNANEPKRAIAVFEYPNAYALWAAPLLALGLPYALKIDQRRMFRILIGFIGLVLTLSRGGILGFAAAAVVAILAAGSKRTRQIFAAAMLAFVLIVATVPNLRYRAILPFKGEKSTVSRFSLWHTADKMIASSPVLGKGLYGFASNFNAYNTDPNLAPLNYPHNIFLNFWVETGLLGLLSFLMICGYKVYEYLRDRTNTYKFGAVLFLIALFVHGLADAPYFLNTLALTFWVVMAL